MSETTDADKPDKTMMQRRAGQLRRAGLAVDAIAEALGVSRSTAKRLLARDAARQRCDVQEIGADALTEELARVDAVLTMAFKMMQGKETTDGDKLRAGGKILEAVALSAKLRGLLEKKVTVTQVEEKPCVEPQRYTDAERAEKIVQLLAKAGAVRD
jgi:orotate phosphoribosyltransferase-like protein